MSGDKTTIDPAAANAAILAGIAALTDELKAISGRQDSIEKRSAQRDARFRADSFTFSPRVKGEDGVAFVRRHDEEEAKLAKDEEESGKEKEEAARDAKKKRKDAEMEMDSKADGAKKDELPENFKKAADGEDDDKDDKKDSAAKDGEDDDKDDKKDSAKDASKKDGEDDDKDDKKDSKKDTRGDAVDPEAFRLLKEKLDRLEAGAKPLSDADINAFGAVQGRADSVYTALGSRARAPMQGESLLAYRRHFVNDLKQYSPTWKDKDLSVVAANDAVFGTVEAQIISEAELAARSPATVKPGELRMRTTRMDSGHTRNEFFGRPSAWMDNFAGPVKQAATKFLVPDSNRGR